MDLPYADFLKHKGYGTPDHMALIRQHGPCPIHRRSFEPIKSMTGWVRQPKGDAAGGVAEAAAAAGGKKKAAAGGEGKKKKGAAVLGEGEEPEAKKPRGGGGQSVKNGNGAAVAE